MTTRTAPAAITASPSLRQDQELTVTINNDEGNPLYIKHPTLGGPDNVYINIAIKGSNTNNQSQPHKTFTFSQYFPEPIIRDIQNYYLSIVSLAFPATEVPLHILNNIVPGSTQTDPNKTDWVFCFTYNNGSVSTDYSQNVEYIPYNSSPVPSAPSANAPGYDQQYTSYYFIENYNVFVKMFNQTLVSIYTAMYNANVAAFGILGLGANDYPFFIYDDSREIFRIVYNKLFVSSGIDLYFTDTFNVFFPGFFTYYYGTGNTNGKDDRVIFENAPNNIYDVTHNFNEQMYSGSPANLNTINQIVVTSNTLRTAFEFVTTDDTNNNFGYSNVIFSLLPNLETPQASKSHITYVTNGQYRLIDIVSTGQINQIDFNVYYTDNNQNIYPIQIPEGLSANAKILFMKKSLKTYIY